MIMGKGPFGNIEMGGIFTVIKVRDHLASYDKDPGWYHEYALRFDTFYQKYNGVFAFPFNQWYDAYVDLEGMGVLDRNVQCFTGYGANETMEIFAGKMRQILDGSGAFSEEDVSKFLKSVSHDEMFLACQGIIKDMDALVDILFGRV